MRRFVAALVFALAVVVAIGPVFWLVGTLTGNGVHVRGGWIRLVVDLVVVGVLLTVGLRLAAADNARRSLNS
jgi:hypothetical protein